VPLRKRSRLRAANRERNVVERYERSGAWGI
jgi:hypothetical protein